MAFLKQKIEIVELCKGVLCVNLGENFQTHINLQNLASIQPRRSPVKIVCNNSRLARGRWARSPLGAAPACTTAEFPRSRAYPQQKSVLVRTMSLNVQNMKRMFGQNWTSTLMQYFKQWSSQTFREFDKIHARMTIFSKKPRIPRKKLKNAEIVQALKWTSPFLKCEKGDHLSLASGTQIWTGSWAESQNLDGK